MTAQGEAALEYARNGLFVLPVYEPASGECSCTLRGKCGHPAKHPRTKHGAKDSSNDESTVTEWWHRWPSANVGIATGPSRLVIVDVDAHRGGFETLHDLAMDLGSDIFADTASWLTGHGGQHFVFAAPQNERVASLSDGLGEGIDLKAYGGYAIAPPSIGVAGPYVHDAAATYGVHPLRPWPKALSAILRLRNKHRVSVRTDVSHNVRHLEGNRNAAMLRYVSALRNLGHDDTHVTAAAHAYNAAYMQPPMASSEVEAIARGSARYCGTNPDDWFEYWSPRLRGKEIRLARFLHELHLQVGDRTTAAASVLQRGTGLSRASVFAARTRLAVVGAIAVVSRGRLAAEIHLTLPRLDHIDSIWGGNLDDMNRGVSKEKLLPNRTAHRHRLLAE